MADITLDLGSKDIDDSLIPAIQDAFGGETLQETQANIRREAWRHLRSVFLNRAEGAYATAHNEGYQVELAAERERLSTGWSD